MKPLIFVFPGNEELGKRVIHGIDGDQGTFILRKFPDEETYIRITCPVQNRKIILICSLHQPDEKLLSVFFFCNLLKDLQAKSICIIVPYLPYMRQDTVFNTGEAITSVYFARLLSSCADELITVDPHLHRRKSMQEIYTIPCTVLHGAILISQWIKDNLPNAVLIGPDSESEQWVAEVAKNAHVPFLISEKIRLGDRKVKLVIPSLENYKNNIPILVDDIISTAHTMIETVKLLKAAGMQDPVCIAVHGVFANHAYEELMSAGAADVLTTNTIFHTTNRMDISQLIIDCLK